jgi:hypothetical protein
MSTVPQAGEPIWTQGFDYQHRRLYIGDGGAAGGVAVAYQTDPASNHKNNYYYNAAQVYTGFTTSAVTPNFITYTPIFVGGNNYEGLGSVEELICEVTTGANGTNVRMALYSSHEDEGTPDALLEESSAIGCKTTGIKTHTMSTTVYPSGWYWLAINASSSSIVFRAFDNLATGWQIGSSASGFVVNNLYYQAHTFGAFPATVTVGGAASLDAAAVRIKV